MLRRSICNNDVNIRRCEVGEGGASKAPVGHGFVCEGGAVTWVQIADKRNSGQKYFLTS